MRREKRVSQKFKRLAKQRAKDLWAFYNKNGVLTLADFRRITKGQYAGVMETFLTHGVDCPPVYDSQDEKNKRKGRALWDEAGRLGQDYLTIKQAAKVLGIKPHEVPGLEKRLLNAGLSLPDIVPDEGRGYDQLASSNGDGRINGVCNPLYHPQGLQVLDYWPGPGDGEITYLLR